MTKYNSVDLLGIVKKCFLLLGEVLLLLVQEEVKMGHKVVTTELRLSLERGPTRSCLSPMQNAVVLTEASKGVQDIEIAPG